MDNVAPSGDDRLSGAGDSTAAQPTGSELLEQLPRPVLSALLQAVISGSNPASVVALSAVRVPVTKHTRTERMHTQLESPCCTDIAPPQWRVKWHTSRQCHSKLRH